MTWQPGQSGNPAGVPKYAKPWRDAINRAIKRREEKDPHALENLAEKLLRKVDDGDVSAIKELGDRQDGKVPQAIVGSEDHPGVKLETQNPRDVAKALMLIFSGATEPTE